MAYCICFSCPSLLNESTHNFCSACGENLLFNNRYRAIDLLGVGNFSITFKAIDEQQSGYPACVVKKFTCRSTDPIEQKAFLDFFLEEVKHLKSIGNHPQVPSLFAYSDIGDQSYLIQELIDGQNLDQELALNGKFTAAQIRELLNSLLPLLDYMHKPEVAVFHSNIKPTNIIRRYSDGALILVNSGPGEAVSKSFGAHRASIDGRPYYILNVSDYTPQVVLVFERWRFQFPASDIYSLGVSCIHLITGMKELDFSDDLSLTWRWHSAIPDNFIDDNLVRILDKMTTQHPSHHRYQSALAVIADLT
jgi:serine/threonine protein kinase